MASLRVPLVCLFAVATGVFSVADETGPVAAPTGVAPLVGPTDIVALASSNRDRWQEPKGNWEFKSDSLTGSGDSRIDFRGPFKPPLTIEFRLQVLKGMRPRVYLGPVTFANEGYERTFALYPSNGDGVPFSYEENRDYPVSLAIEHDGALLTVAGRKIMTATLPIQDLREIGFSGGDWWSKGATRFSEIVIRPRATAALVAAPSAPVVLPEGSSPLQEEFERDAAAIANERKVASDKLAAEYAGRLDALARQLSEEGRPTLAAAARAEKARVDAGATIIEERESRAPFEVLSARAAYLGKLRTLTHDYDAKAAQRAARYLGALEKSVAVTEGAGATKALLDKERARLPQASQPLAQRVTKRTTAAGGDGGGPFEEVAEDDALLTGLILHTGDFAGHHVLVAVQPIFRTAEATRIGTRHGVQRGAPIKLEAEEGYAVGGLNLHFGDRVDGLEIVFMKIKPGRLALDRADSYTSNWVGGKGGGPVQIGGTGNAIVGLHGASGSEFDSLGLIELLPSAAPAPKPRPAAMKEVTRENPATVTVINLTAQPLVESPTREAGKWRTVPEPLRGAKIFSVTPNKHLGVAEYKVTAPGRVYLACNYDYQGNRAPWGGWPEERWMPEDFVENGWARVEGIELRSWEDRTFVVFSKELKAGETGRLRCNKYEPPYFITFTP